MQPLWKSGIPQKVKQLQFDRAIPLQEKNICPHKNVRMNVHSRIIYNRQKVKTTQMAPQLMNASTNVVYPHNGILLGLKKE